MTLRLWPLLLLLLLPGWAMNALLSAVDRRRSAWATDTGEA